MGVDYCAITVVGLRIHINQLKQTITKSVPYDHSSCADYKPSYKFCPNCGEEPALDVSYVDWKSFVKNGTTVKNYKIYRAYSVNGDENWVYIYYAISSRNGPRDYNPNESSEIPFTLEDLTSMREQMKSNLEDTGLWNQDAFGIWTVISFG